MGDLSLKQGETKLKLENKNKFNIILFLKEKVSPLIISGFFTSFSWKKLYVKMKRNTTPYEEPEGRQKEL